MTTRSVLPGKKTYGATALVALAVLFIGLTILITFVLRGARVDLTENELYSIAPGTERILDSIGEPVNLYFFFSQETSSQSPPLRAYAQRVRELLEEMAQRSKGKLRLTVIDPAPFSDEEDRAAEFGLQALPAGGGGQALYFGLAGTNSTDGREKIGFFQPEKEEFLEYDIASLIHRLVHPKRPIIGLLAGLPVEAAFDPSMGRMQDGWTSVAQLRELFEVRTIAADAPAIDDEIDVLLVIHPKNPSPETLYAIDQFVMRGGKLIAFIDPQSENDPLAQMGLNAPPGSRSSTLGALLEAWGVEFDQGKVLGDRGLGLTVSLQPGEQPSKHIAIIGFNRDSMNRKDVVSATLNVVNVMTAGVLKARQGAAITLEPLMESSADSILLPLSRVAFLSNGDSLLDGFKPTGERYMVAARVQGKLQSAYPQGRPASQNPAAPPVTEGKHKVETAEETNLILVADTDILADPLWVRTQNVFGQRLAVPWANNGDFLANAIDNLAGSRDLISIRGRQSFFRPFTQVDELRRQADEQLRAKEQGLRRELQETERKLSELEAGRSGQQGSLVLSPEQETELGRFQQERVRVRKELRNVRRSLDVEIERLGSVVKTLNITLAPLLIAVGAIVLAILRRRRLRAGRAAARTG